MSDRLNVLLIESEPGAAVVAQSELEAAGHIVHRCHEPAANAFPCNAIAEGRRCPLETASIDVALDVRRRPRSEPTVYEDGVSCALHHHVPTVVAGPAALSPFDGYATATLNRTYDVVETCEAAAHAPLPRHTAAATAALHKVMADRGITADVEVTVRRSHGSLVVSVTGSSELDQPGRSMAAVRMCAALREIDTHSRGIDVVFGEAAVPAGQS